jgi:hypothetical protein
VRQRFFSAAEMERKPAEPRPLFRGKITVCSSLHNTILRHVGVGKFSPDADVGDEMVQRRVETEKVSRCEQQPSFLLVTRTIDSSRETANPLCRNAVKDRISDVGRQPLKRLGMVATVRGAPLFSANLLDCYNITL